MTDLTKKTLAGANEIITIEYGFIAALAATVGIASLLAMGISLESIFTGTASDMSSALTQAGGGGVRG